MPVTRLMGVMKVLRRPVGIDLPQLDWNGDLVRLSGVPEIQCGGNNHIAILGVVVKLGKRFLAQLCEHVVERHCFEIRQRRKDRLQALAAPIGK